MHKLENDLANCVRESARAILQWLVTNVEPELDEMPGVIKRKDKNFRRLSEKAGRSCVVTCFGDIELHRARYRQGRDGKTIFPLELLLGIEAGFTPAAASMIGKQFATSGSSQGRTREMIFERTGGGKKLGTVYLASTTQANQENLSRNLTSLVTKVVRACSSNLPKIVYVTDAGKIETAYWKNVLRKFFVSRSLGERCRDINRVVIH